MSTQSRNAPSPKASPQKPRSRFTPRPAGGLALGERDSALLTDLYVHAAMSRQQIQTLYFGSVPRCNARLRQLFDFHFVSRFYSPLAPFGAQAIYSPGKAAAPVICEHLREAPAYEGLEPVTLSEVRAQCQAHTAPLFLEHTLAIVQFRLDVLAALSAPTHNGSVQPWQMERWLPERLVQHAYDVRAEGGTWRREVFKPDAFLRLTRCQTPGDPPQEPVYRIYQEPAYRNYFVEIDRGHTSARAFSGKLHLHQRYLSSGLFAEVFGPGSFRTLVVMTGPRRREHLRALVEEAGSDLFWLTTFADIATHGPLAPHWSAPGTPHPVGLLAEDNA